jgi:hypothetical protein
MASHPFYVVMSYVVILKSINRRFRSEVDNVKFNEYIFANVYVAYLEQKAMLDV